ncbi:aspartate/glutamate racemase family protein [Sutcliffiella cohnii]|uniref:aspartate/glutamate racemase family protein n=1 Tax=Sutcliffiella cohnii TaxID=33932 RepID=UPI002E24B0D9|nr:aspartate/glutamate racemase family protein [Sutcliffiella cohnii]
MKTIGLIGGLSWESTAEYYRIINETVKEQLGKLHSAKVLLHSFDFEEIVQLQHNGQWDKATQKMIEAGKTLENGGADFVVICTNTMHIMSEEMTDNLNIPLLHIVDCFGANIQKEKIKKVGLLGTKFTMEQPFYRDLLNEKGIEVIIPDEEERHIVHDIIYHELCKGIIKEESKDMYLSIIHSLKENGAEGVILGCTEIPLLIQQSDTPVPLFDSTAIHAIAAAKEALK